MTIAQEVKKHLSAHPKDAHAAFFENLGAQWSKRKGVWRWVFADGSQANFSLVDITTTNRERWRYKIVEDNGRVIETGPICTEQ